MSFNLGGLFLLARTLVFGVLTIYLMAAGVLIGSCGKWKDQPKLPMIFAFILFPLFLFLQIPLDLGAMIVRNVKWRKISHGVH